MNLFREPVMLVANRATSLCLIPIVIFFHHLLYLFIRKFIRSLLKMMRNEQLGETESSTRATNFAVQPFFGVEQVIVNNTNFMPFAKKNIIPFEKENIIPLKKKNCRNKPEGRKTALAGASLFTSHLLEIQTWTCLLPVLIRNLFSSIYLLNLFRRGKIF